MWSFFIQSDPLVSKLFRSYLILSYFVRCCLMHSNLILSYSLQSNFFYPVRSAPMWSDYVLSDSIISYPILSNPLQSDPFWSCPILSNLIFFDLSDPIQSDPIRSYPILSYFIRSDPFISYPILSVLASAYVTLKNLDTRVIELYIQSLQFWNLTFNSSAVRQMLHRCNSRTGRGTCFLWPDERNLLLQWSTNHTSDMCNA